MSGIGAMMDDMADTTARSLQMLELLQSAQQRSGAELAERLGVDERTIRRDVARLVEIGVPVATLRGRYGGYRLETGQRILPVMFTNEEVIAVFLGLVRAQRTSPHPEVAAQTALAKITRALPAADAERIDALLRTMVTPSPPAVADPDPAVMLTLADAVDRRRVLDLRYQNGRGAPSRRTIHPYGVVSHSDRWYLIAFDADAREERTFRVDRVRTIRPTSGSFVPRPDPITAESLPEHFADAEYRWRVVLRIQQTRERIRTHLPRSVARVEPMSCTDDPERGAAGSWHRVEIHAENLDWIPPVLAALACEVRIDGPDELRDLVRATAVRMQEAANGGARTHAESQAQDAFR